MDLNAEGPLFHGAELNVPIFATHNVIRLRGGEIYFKTAARASPRYQYRRRGGNKPDAVIGAIGAVASASVFLNDDQRLVMKWQDATRETDRTHVLEKAAAADTTYEIYIENTPLYLDPPREQDLPSWTNSFITTRSWLYRKGPTDSHSCQSFGGYQDSWGRQMFLVR